MRVVVTSVASLASCAGALALLAVVGLPDVSLAQITPSSPTRTAPSRSTSATAFAWEIEVHGGAMRGTSPDGGSPIATFPTGVTLPTPTGGPSRRISSWYFGDGAALHREAAAALAPGTATIVALDEVLRSAFGERQSGGSFGVRVSRRLSGKFSAEFSLDRGQTPYDVTDRARAGIEATRASFSPAFVAILSDPVLTQVTPSSVSTITDGSRGQTSATGAVRIDLMPATAGTGRRGVRPYAVVGAGVMFNGDEEAGATLEGNYRFLFANVVAFDETDVVRVSVRQPAKSLVGVVGGGVAVDVGRRHGFRADVRAHLSAHESETFVDATPNVARLEPNLYIWRNQTPTVAFANYSGASVPSSLSGPAVTGLKTFTGSGTFAQLNITAGYYFRF